jgi:hypothetical protein
VVKLPMRCLIRVFLIGCLLSVPCAAVASDSLTLSGVQLVGTTRLSAEDVVQGLGLKVGESTTRQDLLRACDHFSQLKLFESSHCRYRIEGESISLTIFVKDTWGGMPVVFDNFVWMTRAELLARLRHELPLFMSELPESSGLTNDIIRVLEQVVAEHGIKAHVMYDGSFWTIRGLNVFIVEGISTPVITLQIEGENAPTPEELQRWAQFYMTENFSAARLTWVIRWIIRDFYFSRGYMRPVVGKPVVQCLGERDGAFQVRVIVPITPGDVYTFESVKFKGLAEAWTTLLLQEWKLRPGDPYDDSYTDSFIEQILSAPWAQHSKTESDTAPWCAKVDETGKKVSVTISVEAPKRTYRVKGGESCGGVTKFLKYPPVP